ncbi:MULTISPECIES: exodeoxyribonuclease VII small subunit [unclassified Oceanispirochaeta]|uniref:exodeoxyribonuclease VII small subunit n=1 Tax=unclassified Oceanispirochaeta TaxID=2635722 RepID=UPI000E09956C|nr:MULTISPECIES: exodeoxyribonuclease VII small subunit [unclassified Oceanispirochaeta]MBF9017669.1 exodeoxyribonuclease VII small subunit [Oceanispirochaeta sp. M2]NPD74241.1 exodeoxyribonuclease VII small subunit [Oceanispirochaeta sp. M1]RDG29947.1 exodeoxyribonuclease VII small subunit [Oceanispirochaeta sp. M1]
MKFEKKIKRLEEITEIIKTAAVDFDEQLKLYKEGSGLAQEIEKELDSAEQMIEEIKVDDQKEK